MSDKQRKKASSTPGRQTATCAVRGDGRRCAPINETVIAGSAADSIDAYAACSCGRRFPLSRSARARLLAHVPPAPLLSRGSNTLEAIAFDQRLAVTVWPIDRLSAFAKPGVVPVGTPVLHAPAEPAPVITKGLVKLGLHMTSVMRSARGIGLAANQVGVPVQVLIHKMDSVAPAMLINPTLLRQSGVWEYNEGCLSLKVDETAAPVRRPKSVMVRAATIEGKTIVLNADELLARVLLHEIDHLSGIEYVQRLVGRERSRVYQAMRERGIDVACMPPKPYDDFSPGRAVTNTGRV